MKIYLDFNKMNSSSFPITKCISMCYFSDTCDPQSLELRREAW